MQQTASLTGAAQLEVKICKWCLSVLSRITPNNRITPATSASDPDYSARSRCPEAPDNWRRLDLFLRAGRAKDPLAGRDTNGRRGALDAVGFRATRQYSPRIGFARQTKQHLHPSAM